MSNKHIPVLLNEVITSLNIKKNGIYVDATAGRGGHSEEILKCLKSGKLICIDQDSEAIEYLKEKFLGKDVLVLKANFRNLKEVLKQNGIEKVDGILADLGVSSPQLDDLERGFSYHNESKIDMRMDQDSKIDAAWILNKYDETQLYEVFKKYGEIKAPGRVIKGILNFRKSKPIETTKQLVEIIKENTSWKDLKSQKHPAKVYFQALRIEVNDEINSLKRLLDQVKDLLNKNGVASVITFHSLEDRIVKHTFDSWSINPIPKEIPIVKDPDFIFHRKAVVASKEELEQNKRSRSAKLWVIRKNV